MPPAPIPCPWSGLTIENIISHDSESAYDLKSDEVYVCEHISNLETEQKRRQTLKPYFYSPIEVAKFAFESAPLPQTAAPCV